MDLYSSGKHSGSFGIFSNCFIIALTFLIQVRECLMNSPSVIGATFATPQEISGLAITANLSCARKDPNFEKSVELVIRLSFLISLFWCLWNSFSSASFSTPEISVLSHSLSRLEIVEGYCQKDGSICFQLARYHQRMLHIDLAVWHQDA